MEHFGLERQDTGVEVAGWQRQPEVEVAVQVLVATEVAYSVWSFLKEKNDIMIDASLHNAMQN